MPSPGRQKKDRYIGPPRPLTCDDMATILAPMRPVQVNPARLRDSHHRIARLVASGIKTQLEVAHLTGYSVQRIGVLLASPAMQDLIAHYRAMLIDDWRDDQRSDFDQDLADLRMAKRMRRDHLEAADEAGELPRWVNNMVADLEDRVGVAKKSVHFNADGKDMAILIEKQLAERRAAAESKVINVEPSPEGLRRRI